MQVQGLEEISVKGRRERKEGGRVSIPELRKGHPEDEDELEDVVEGCEVEG